MRAGPVTLEGEHVRLEPLAESHATALAAAAACDTELYRWSPVPVTRADALAYIKTALAWQAAGTAIPFATVRRSDNRVIGSTRFFHVEYWSWPATHPRHGRNVPDGCEIGYSWLAREATRTAANTEAKLLMLSHAFETLGVYRVCFHADMWNERSRAALARLGATFEGELRRIAWRSTACPAIPPDSRSLPRSGQRARNGSKAASRVADGVRRVI
jgi:RimJ/RimL family protein N-acetyltransferase